MTDEMLVILVRAREELQLLRGMQRLARTNPLRHDEDVPGYLLEYEAMRNRVVARGAK